MVGYSSSNTSRRSWPDRRFERAVERVPNRMTEPLPPADVVDDGVTDILTDHEVVHVQPSNAELAEATEHRGEIGFITDVSDWDNEDPLR